MEKLNLPPFYVGQKVVYITGISMLKDSIHTVTCILSHPCGCFSILINGEPPGIIEGNSETIICERCDKTYPRNIDDKRGWEPNSFRPLQQQNFPLIKLSKIMEKEKEEILIPN